MKSFVNNNKVSWLSRAFLMICCVALFASCDDKEEPFVTIYPELSDQIVEVGDVISISFSVDNVWTLTTNAPAWCKFSASTGKAGSHEVDITITDDNLNYLNDDVATIWFEKIKSGGEQANHLIEVEFTREKWEMTARIYDVYNDDLASDDTFMLTVERASDGKLYRQMNIKTTYNWEVDTRDFPDWLAVESLDGTTNMGGEFIDGVVYGHYSKPVGLRLVADPAKFDVTGDTYEFQFKYSADKTLGAKVKVGVNALSDTYLKHDSKLWDPLKVDVDGNITVGAEQKTSIEVNVVSYDANYEVVVIDVTDRNSFTKGDWVVGTKSSNGARAAMATTKVELSVKENTGAPRNGMVFFLPASVAASVSPDDLVEDIGGEKVMAVEAYKDYWVVDFAQAGESLAYTMSIFVGGPQNNSTSFMPFLNTSVAADMEITEDTIEGIFGTSVVYAATMPAAGGSLPIQINNLVGLPEVDGLVVLLEDGASGSQVAVTMYADMTEMMGVSATAVLMNITATEMSADIGMGFSMMRIYIFPDGLSPELAGVITLFEDK